MPSATNDNPIQYTPPLPTYFQKSGVSRQDISYCRTTKYTPNPCFPAHEIILYAKVKRRADNVKRYRDNVKRYRESVKRYGDNVKPHSG